MTDYTDLARRAVACKHWRWTRGMVAVTASGAHFLRGTDTWEWDDHGALPGGPPQSEIAALLAGELLPDINDPATIGCLLTLVQEAWGDRLESISILPQGHYVVYLRDRGHISGGIDALVVALETCNMPPDFDQKIDQFLSVVDSHLGRGTQHVLCYWPVERLRWHLSAARDNLEWFARGLNAQRLMGQPDSAIYLQNIQQAEAFIREGEALLALKQGMPNVTEPEGGPDPEFV